MKKLGRKLISWTLLIIFLSTFAIEPLRVKAASTSADTLAGLRKELQEFQAEKKAAENKKKYTQSQINQKNQDIINARAEKEASEAKIEVAKKSVEESKVKISEYQEKTKETLAIYQLMMSDNSYLEFVTDSSSMTELVMRSDAIEQLIQYNQEQLDTLDKLIKENEQKQIDLKKYEEELDKNIVAYQNKIDDLGAELVNLEDIAVDAAGEIQYRKDIIKMYENMGCKENETLEACSARTSTNGTWLKPFNKGQISSLFGYRQGGKGISSNHSGIDIAISEGTAVLSTTVGTVASILRRQSCGGNQVYVHSYVNGKTYMVLYAHLKDISVTTGQKVTQSTVIGHSGGYSTSVDHGGYDTCAHGAHLHLSVSQTASSKYSAFMANLINPPGYPKTKGAWFYSRYQWFD